VFSADAYVQQRRPRSVLLPPLVKQASSPAHSISENNLTPHAYHVGPHRGAGIAGLAGRHLSGERRPVFRSAGGKNTIAGAPKRSCDAARPSWPKGRKSAAPQLGPEYFHGKARLRRNTTGSSVRSQGRGADASIFWEDSSQIILLFGQTLDGQFRERSGFELEFRIDLPMDY